MGKFISEERNIIINELLKFGKIEEISKEELSMFITFEDFL
jgi:hypothetical protein